MAGLELHYCAIMPLTTRLSQQVRSWLIAKRKPHCAIGQLTDAATDVSGAYTWPIRRMPGNQCQIETTTLARRRIAGDKRRSARASRWVVDFPHPVFERFLRSDFCSCCVLPACDDARANLS